MKLFTHGYFPWDLNGGGADYHAWVKEWGMWLIVAELKLFKKHPSITQHTVTIHHRFKAACKFKFAHQKKNKTHLQWFKVLTLDRFADSNLSERLCLHFCSAAKWDILKATGWWVECVWMSVHIHLRHQPCPSLSHYRCSEAVQTTTSSYLPRREVAAWAKIWASGLACSLPVSHVPADIHQRFYSFSSRCEWKQHLPIGSKSPDPVSLDKTTFVLCVFAQSIKRSFLVSGEAACFFITLQTDKLHENDCV